jgi:alanyl-tRNA synthetase
MTSPAAASDTPTTRLYYDDALLARFSATVTQVAEGGRVVYLDRSAFYPTSGGQPHDLGTLADVAIVNVVDEEDRVAHHLAEPLGLPAGAMVVGQVDMVRRLDHMQQHTAQHLLSAMLTDEYGWPTVSVHFGDDTSTVDVSGVDGIDADTLAAIEHRVNTLALGNHAVTVSYEDAAEATGLRKPSDRDGTLRIVTIEGLDRSACGGTHVARTGEIGAVLLRRAERTRGHTRIEFIAGHRAVRRARVDADLLVRAARPLSAAPADLPVLVEQQLARVTELERERKRLSSELAVHEAQALWRAAMPDAQGVRRIHTRVSGAVKEAEPLVQQLLAMGSCVVLVTNDGTGGVLFAASAESGVDAGQTLRSALQNAGGRGGGSPRVAQGAVAQPTDLPIVMEALGY